MGLKRGAYVIFFPQLFTALAFSLAVVTFFSGYHSATGLRNVNFLQLDLSDLSIDGYSLSSLESDASKQLNVSTYYTVAMNGWCYGDSVNNVSTCVSPNEPFYFNFETLLDVVGLSSLMSSLPSNIQEYNTLSKQLTLGASGAFLATIILTFIQFCVGFISICSGVGTCMASFCSFLATISSAIGAGMATGVYCEYKLRINDAASTLGVKASLGNAGFGLAWGTVASLIVADVLICLVSCFSKRKTRYVTIPEKEYQYTEM